LITINCNIQNPKHLKRFLGFKKTTTLQFSTHISLLLLAFLFVCFTACTNKKAKIAISKPSTSLNQIGKIVGKELSESSKLNMDFEYIENTAGSYGNFEAIENGKARFAIGSNLMYDQQHAAFNFKNVRVILPLYKLVLLITHLDTLKASSLQDLVRNRKIGIGPKKSNTSKLCLYIFSELGLDTTDFTPVYSSYLENEVGKNGIEVSCQFTGLFNPRLKNLVARDSIEIFSLETDPKPFQSQWLLSGISQKLWTSSPYILPPSVFGNKPKKAIFTLSVQGCLYGSKDLDETEVYNLIEEMVKLKPNFMKKNAYFSDIDPNYSDNYFFPLHEGAIHFKNRMKPTFWERYIEAIGLIFSTVFFVGGIVIPFLIRQKRRKARKYELIVKEVLEATLLENKTVSNQELQKIKQRIIKKLSKDKIDYDDELQNLLLLILTSENQNRNYLANQANSSNKQNL
jgi:TRAP-type uncharacterized transport system substrate-binding protein